MSVVTMASWPDVVLYSFVGVGILVLAAICCILLRVIIRCLYLGAVRVSNVPVMMTASSADSTETTITFDNRHTVTDTTQQSRGRRLDDILDAD